MRLLGNAFNSLLQIPYREADNCSVKKYSAFCEPEISLPPSQDIAVRPFPAPDEHNPCLPRFFL